MTDLTPRERQICGYLCKGWNSKEIATKLGISHRTAEDHRAHILKKCRVRNVVELVRQFYKIEERELDRELVAIAIEPGAEIDLRPGSVNRIIR